MVKCEPAQAHTAEDTVCKTMTAPGEAEMSAQLQECCFAGAAKTILHPPGNYINRRLYEPDELGTRYIIVLCWHATTAAACLFVVSIACCAPVRSIK
jgi:hypothetical protein